MTDIISAGIFNPVLYFIYADYKSAANVVRITNTDELVIMLIFHLHDVFLTKNSHLYQ